MHARKGRVVYPSDVDSSRTRSKLRGLGHLGRKRGGGGHRLATIRARGIGPNDSAATGIPRASFLINVFSKRGSFTYPLSLGGSR